MAQRIIEIISKDKRYRKTPYPAKAFEHQRFGTFLTGQHVDPSDPRTSNFLTVSEMRRQEKLSNTKKAMFPLDCVINPDESIMIQHRDRLNLTLKNEDNEDSIIPSDYENPNDFAKYRFLLFQDVVAPNEHTYNPGRHFFYLFDKEESAKTKLSIRDLKFQAEDFIRKNITSANYMEFALLLKYKSKTPLNVSKMMSELEVRQAIFELLDKDPQAVLACNSKKYPMVNKELFVLRMMDKELITESNGTFYDGGKILGSTIGQIVETLDKEEVLKQKFSRLINGSSVPSDTKNEFKKTKVKVEVSKETEEPEDNEDDKSKEEGSAFEAPPSPAITQE